MSRLRSSSSRSVSLFPFLAVLVCAMGALILLLLVTTRRIRREKITRQRTPAARKVARHRPVPARRKKPEEPAVEPQLPPLLTRPNNAARTDRILADARRRIREERIRREKELTRLQTEYNRLQQRYRQAQRQLQDDRAKLESLRRSVRLLTAQKAEAEKKGAAMQIRIAQLQKQIAQRAGQLTQLRRAIAQREAERARASSRFAIIPFDGYTGTTRRPIFIECTQKSIRFLPEGVTLTPDDLRGFSSARNPLLAGTRALVEYWSARHQLNRREPKPYVLLLVRPGGAVAYYAARKMLHSLKQPIGYELIEENWKLALPKADPRAKAVCQLAVDRALAAPRDEFVAGRKQRYSPAGRGAGAGRSRRMRFNRATGRFEVVDAHGDRPDENGDSGRKNPLHSGFGPIVTAEDHVPPAASRRSSNAYRSRNTSEKGHAARLSPRVSAGRSRSASSAPSVAGRFPGSSPSSPASSSFSSRRSASGDNPDRAEGGRPRRDRDTVRRHSPGRMPAGLAAAGDAGPHSLTGTTYAKRPQPDRMDPNRTNTSRAHPGGTDANRAHANGANTDRTDVPLWPLKRDDHSAGGSPSARGDSLSQRQRQRPSLARGDAPPATFPGNGGENGTNNPRRDSDNTPHNPGKIDSRGTPDSSSDHRFQDRNSPDRNSPGRAAAGTVFSGRTLPGRNDFNATKGSGANSSAAVPPQVMPLAGHPGGNSNRRSVSAGRRWGLSHPRGGIGFEKEIRIWCAADRVIVGDRYTFRMKQPVEDERLFRTVVLAVEGEVRAWGRAPQGFYWVPVVRFVVSPGGNRHYERLHRPLQKLGLETRTEFRLEAPPSLSAGGNHVP